MYQPLVPCPACNRHLRATEPRCPFCDAIVASDLANAAIPGATQRLGRAATFVFASTLALAGCSDSVRPDDANPSDTVTGADTAGSSDTGTADTSEADRPAPSDAPVDHGNVFPPYGIPPPQDDGVADDGGFQAMYGTPPPRDGGPDDNGGSMAEYGGPPLDGG